jgi:hypothetical protein
VGVRIGVGAIVGVKIGVGLGVGEDINVGIGVDASVGIVAATVGVGASIGVGVAWVQADTKVIASIIIIIDAASQISTRFFMETLLQNTYVKRAKYQQLISVCTQYPVSPSLLSWD